MTTDMDLLAINTIRTLSMDAVQKAKSGHPGTPMALAPLAYTLWQRVLNFDPAHPIWPNRDRFILSNGHASMLLYSLLHLSQVKAVSSQYEQLGDLSVSLDDIKNFRQLDSKCPGHPEYRWTSGVETTTGPLGQGISNSVGMAMAALWQAKYFNRPGFDMFSYRVYAICGDGDLMEGVGSEAASMAGHLKLHNLCWIYDSNRITIEGETDLSFSDDVATRFLGYGWNVMRVSDANDTLRIQHALESFREVTDRPTIIILDSHIGYGAPNKQDKASAHGEPLGDEEIRHTKKFYGWPEDAHFLVPDGVIQHFADGIGKRGKESRARWLTLFGEYEKSFPELAHQLQHMQRRQLPKDWDADLPVFPADEKGMATRVSSGKVLNAVAKRVPWLLGGSADLGPSTKTYIDKEASFSASNYGGRNIHFGIRENAMASICNGLSLSKMRPYGATFLTFSDYCRPGIRLSALMEIPVLYIFTHDSIGVGEDGPTHQPIEHLASLRAIPGLVVMRPADANEVTECWRLIMHHARDPVALILSRQDLPTFDRTKYTPASGVAQGAYVLADSLDPQVILLSTGSEVYLCINAYEQLKSKGVRARVVSMPSWEIFDRQTKAYKDSVLPPKIKARVAVEQASVMGWDRFVGDHGEIIGMHTFGKSAPLHELQNYFGFKPERIVEAALNQIKEG
jgi:transketolase